MQKKLIAANWKMNHGLSETRSFIENFSVGTDADVLICPPATSLEAASKLLADSKVLLGAQNMHYEESGAYTGEISPLFLREIGCTHVIIGHSERRHVFGEDNSLINKKVKSALGHELVPILCVGEKLEQREKGITNQVIEKQIKEGLAGISGISKVVIAYEPVWAIGTGRTATPEIAQDVHKYIRELLSEMYDSNDIKIIYGGSVKPDNVSKLMMQDDIDGALVGGASLEPESFAKIVKNSKTF